MEVLGQLNPSVMVDLDLDTYDFGRLSSLGTLFRNVGEQLLHGGRQARIACLQELATQAPQALCSIALHVPFDVLVRELDGVIYDTVGSEGAAAAAFPSLTIPIGGVDTNRLARDHSWHGDKMRVSPASPRPASGDHTEVRRNSVMSALYRAGTLLGRRKDADADGLGWEASQHLSDPHQSSADMDADDNGPIDRTWHGTKVSQEQLQSGSYEYSAVPRHGSLRLPPSKPYGFEGMQLVPRAGMLDALQLLSGVLGMEFLINFTMPCLRHKDSDQVQLARLIGQLHYSATTAGCSDAAGELRAIHIRMLRSGDELQQINSIKSLPDFTRHDSMPVAAHIEKCCELLVEILCDNAAAMPDSTRLHLLESFVYVVPSFVRRSDEDILQHEVGVSGGTALTHQIQHPKTLQGLDSRRISAAMHSAVCRLLEAATQARQDKWLADGGPHRASEAGGSGGLPPIPAAPDRDDMTTQGLWNASPTAEAKTKRTLEERYVDAALAVVRMCGRDRRRRFTAQELVNVARAMGPWRVMIACSFIHRALASGLAALSRQVMALDDHGERRFTL